MQMQQQNYVSKHMQSVTECQRKYTSDYIPYLWQLTPHKPSHFPAVRSL